MKKQKLTIRPRPLESASKPRKCTVTLICDGVPMTVEGEYVAATDGVSLRLKDKLKAHRFQTCTCTVYGLNDPSVSTSLLLKPGVEGIYKMYPGSIVSKRRHPLIDGAARLFDFGGSYDPIPHHGSAEESDANALAADWGSVGHDLANALVVYDRSKNK